VNDQASFCRVYRNITKNETESNIQIIDNNNDIFETDEEISGHFNKMFIDKVETLKKNMKTSEMDKK